MMEGKKPCAAKNSGLWLVPELEHDQMDTDVYPLHINPFRCVCECC